MTTKIISAFVVVGLVVTVAIFYVFDQFVTSVGSEAVKSWQHSLGTEISEGNILTSVSQSQRLLLSSEFIKGVVVYDISTPNPRILLEFGEKPEPPKHPSIGFRVTSSGFLKKQIFLPDPGHGDVIVGFKIYSRQVEIVFWETASVISALILLFGGSILFIKHRESERIRAYATKATQAAHDLAQPLATLNTLAHEFQDSSKTLTALKSVIARINGITGDLWAERRQRHENLSLSQPQNFFERLKSLVIEKNILAGPQVKISLQGEIGSYDGGAQNDRLLRAFANIVDNSIEAVSEGGRVHLMVTEDREAVTFSVEDNGKGIPSEIVPKLGESGFSFDKPLGTGLGLHSAKTLAESMGGNLTISSELGRGTTVTIKIPATTSCQKLFLTADTEVLVLDDDPQWRQTWKEYFESHGIENKVSFFSDPQQFEHHLNTRDCRQVFVLSDFDLKSDRDGLEVLQANGLTEQSALVTGMDNDPDVCSRARKLRIPVFAKTNLDAIPIELI